MTYRTRHCGEFEASQIGEEVDASGWTARLRDHGGLVFIDLRDRSGVVQLVIDPEHAPKAIEVAQSIRVESVIHARGKVVARTDGTVNPNLPTGAPRAIRCRSSSTTRTSTRRCASAIARSICAATRCRRTSRSARR